jgi:predicted RNA-binding protein with PIN domain
MALVRILIDGYSLLHHWREIARGQPRYSAVARDELVNRLAQYQDAVGTPVSVFFDGSGPKRPSADNPRSGVEILYSRGGQTADQMIERTVYRMIPFGQVLVVTDDFAERDTVLSLGAMAASCQSFVEELSYAVKEFGLELKHHNLREQRKFKRPAPC